MCRKFSAVMCRTAVMLFCVAVLLVPLSAQTAQCPVISWQLTAGQTINVGTLQVWNSATTLYVKYTLTYPGAYFGTLHLWVGSDIANVPSNPQGTPVPGQFPFHYTPGNNTTTEYTFAIPFNDANLSDVNSACGAKLVVVAHAEVNMPGGETETAFGGPNGVNIQEPGRWYYWGEYTICCEEGPPPIPVCETAFAKGGYVFTTDPKANPEGLPTLRLARNRWGWAVNLTSPGTTVYDIWAGAGLNRTSNGTKVGTLTVNWNGTTAVVTYSMFSGYYLDEVHLYAGDARPTTAAPGQYGNLAYLNQATTYVFNVPLQDTDAQGGVWLIAHAVVCSNVVLEVD